MFTKFSSCLWILVSYLVTNPVIGSYANEVSNLTIIGHEALPLSIPWIVQVGYYDDLNNTSYICRGSLITTKLVLTAEHCVQNEKDLHYVVLLGADDRDEDHSTEQLIGVHHFQVFEDYFTRLFYIVEGYLIFNGTAVLTLERPAEINLYVKPVALAKRAHQGIDFHPKHPDSNDGNNLIRYSVHDRDYLPWTQQLDELLGVYKNPGIQEGNAHVCSYNEEKPVGKVCAVDVERWGPCTSANKYNYYKGAPCIFLTMDKILDWQPEAYNDTGNLPELMPEDLKHYVNMTRDRNNAWVSCEGESAADEENMGPIQYIPRRGFAGYYFPYNREEGYLKPLVAVWFERPNFDVTIHIECKIWAKNIDHDNPEIRSSVHFKLRIG